MIPLRDNQRRNSLPVLTLTLVVLNLIIYIWDRKGQIFGPNVVFADLAMRPVEVMDSLKAIARNDPNSNLFAFVTVLTSMFMHASPTHVLGNIIFLMVFGPAVEEAIGGPRFALYYVAWGLAAATAQIYVDPTSAAPTLGASGAIGGVLGAYFLLFPGNKIQIMFPPLLFLSFGIRAWILFGLWFCWQVFVPQNGVANWAHVGGFLAGMLTVLVMGGPSSVLKERKSEYEVA